MFLPETDTKDNGSGIKHLGCWGDQGIPHSARAISGGARLLEHWHEYKNGIRDVIEDCYNYARSQDWSVFAVQYQYECYTSADAENTYQKHGEVDRCSNGKGGFNAMDVYKILGLSPGECRLKCKEDYHDDD